ncbi:hypothetical protein RICGR_0604 [Rickettsiella grylli]|uniref:Uncharacterized protein n=1 Tax=Rickettsiella grylli TaxID=59196 RepID=A8PM29_9COXI|nr:hypothetical protein RICGR_0604 [Rickettsiella grylli]
MTLHAVARVSPNKMLLSTFADSSEPSYTAVMRIVMVCNDKK